MPVLPNPFEFTPMATPNAVVPAAASASAPVSGAAAKHIRFDVLEEILSFPPIDLSPSPLFLRMVR